MENIQIEKPLRLIGNGRKTTCIDGGGVGTVVNISGGNTQISEFTIKNSGTSGNDAGIAVHSDYNLFIENSIVENNYGLKNSLPTLYNNKIYHNNFIDNIHNAYAKGNTLWDNGYPSGGNYWSDYTGVDNFSGPDQNESGPDGIGDIPYSIPGGINQEDNYPLMVPWGNSPPCTPSITGPTSGKAGIPYNYNLSSTDPNGDNVYYYVDWGDSTNSGWLGPYASGLEKTASHMWSQQGTYTIKIMAKDEHGEESNWGSLSVTMPLDLQISQSQSLLSLLRFAFANKISLLTVILQNIQITTSISEGPASSDVSQIVESDSSDASTITKITDTQSTSDTKSTVIISDESDANDITKSTDTDLDTEKSSSDQNVGNSKQLVIAK
jgi:hypothetical protein